MLDTAPPAGKYGYHEPFKYPERSWPDQDITQAPIWCEVGLRDGNQALENPMNIEQKLAYFQALVAMGYKEIEVGFPSASETDFQFCRRLIEEGHIPEDVKIQVLVQCRPELIERTCEALKGAKQAIFHFYNSTDPVQRELTFKLKKEQIAEMAVQGATMAREQAQAQLPDTDITFQYSPESFSDTEIDYALDVVHRVMDVINPTKEKPMIINLPQTVQRHTPDEFADRIEWFSDNVRDRAALVLSVHTHNDCGTGVAAAELAMKAGADRVEGVLFGNGERAGNCDITTMAGNLYSRGIDPQIDLSDLERVREIYESTTNMEVHDRHPYIGKLVFTAYSGSHQDSIKKGMDAMMASAKAKLSNWARWLVHYIHVDPKDMGREYEAVKVNSQSGKGGTAFVLQHKYGIEVPKAMQTEVHGYVQAQSENSDLMTAEDIYEIFVENFIDRETFNLVNFELSTDDDVTTIQATISVERDEAIEINGTGDGPMSALVDALRNAGLNGFKLKDYEQSAMAEGSGAAAASFVALDYGGEITWGASTHESTTRSALEAILSAMGRQRKKLRVA